MSAGSLAGKVAVVAGATRGAGRAIAEMLGEAGAAVYCTGRSTRAGKAAADGAGKGPREGVGAAGETGGPGPAFVLARRPETIEETAERVDARGGRGIPVRVDHTSEAEVKALFERVRAEAGRLDILINDVWGGDELTEWGKPFWELSMEMGLRMQERAVHSHILTARYGAPLLIGAGAGLLVEVTDGDSPRYRGNLFYDLAKASAIRLALGMGEELKPKGVTALAVTPGFLRSEAMLEYFGVDESDWRDGGRRDPHFLASESPYYVARAIRALACDPQVSRKAGGVYTSWGLAREYGFTDMDGSRPDWGRHYAEHVEGAAGEKAGAG